MSFRWGPKLLEVNSSSLPQRESLARFPESRESVDSQALSWLATDPRRQQVVDGHGVALVLVFARARARLWLDEADRRWTGGDRGGAAGAYASVFAGPPLSWSVPDLDGIVFARAGLRWTRAGAPQAGGSATAAHQFVESVIGALARVERGRERPHELLQREVVPDAIIRAAALVHHWLRSLGTPPAAASRPARGKREVSALTSTELKTACVEALLDAPQHVDEFQAWCRATVKAAVDSRRAARRHDWGASPATSP